MVMQKEEESKAKFVEKKKEAKEKFAVDKVFPKRAGDYNNAKKAKKGVVGLGPSTKSKKKELNADAEIEQYLKELGLD